MDSQNAITPSWNARCGAQAFRVQECTLWQGIASPRKNRIHAKDGGERVEEGEEGNGGGYHKDRAFFLFQFSPFRRPVSTSVSPSSHHPFHFFTSLSLPSSFPPFRSLVPFLLSGTGRWPDLVKHIRRSLHGLWTAWNAVHARENARCNLEERDFYIKFWWRERERNGVKHGGNGWLVMVVVVVSRYDDAPVSSELLKRHAAGKPASERGEDQRTGSRRDSRCGSLSRFLSLLPFSPASSPRNLVAFRSRDRGFYAFQTAGLFAAYRVQDEAMQIVREQVARARGLVTRRPLNFIEATGPSRESELFRGRSMQRFVFGGWRSAWTLLAKTLENVSLFNSLILRCVFYAPGSRSPAWIVDFAILRF